MSLLSFAGTVGKQIFQSSEQIKAANPALSAGQISQQQSHLIEQHIRELGLDISNLSLQFDGNGSVLLSGEAATQADFEKASLAAGNLLYVFRVENRMTVAASPFREIKTYTVKSGDNLSRISKEVYGDTNKYPLIFEANKPMLKDPDEIYPGQVLRIPQD